MRMLDQMVDQGTVVGSYRIEALLGRGGMGTVFRSRHIDSGRVVALKILAERLDAAPGLSARFRSEGRAQASLEHPHVVTVYEAGESEHGLYLAMRLIDGPPLVDLIRERSLDAGRSLDLLGQIAGALDAAHAAGLVHRDVKPHNVLVGPGDHAYLADFGLTRGGGEASVTASGAIVGTVSYLAPEVVRGGEAGPASDRYAFAAMAFECLTGTVVFPRTSNTAVLFAHANDPPPRIGARRAELGDELDDLFERALAKDPSERPASARELVEAIRRGLERSDAGELPPPPPAGAAALRHDTTSDPAVLNGAAVRPATRRRAGRRTVALAALAGAAIVAVAWAVLGGGDDPPAAAAAAVDGPGLPYVGADLNGARATPLDCRGRPPQRSSPPCTVVQGALAGATLVVPQNGVIRKWSVRGARGDVSLVVLRPRDGGAFQVSLSATEATGSADVQTFDTDVDVERGDLVGLVVGAGSAVGVRPGVSGARVDRWIPPVPGAGRPPDRRGGAGFDSELMLRVGILPGGERRVPPQVTGAAAERLPAGKAVAQTRVKLGKRTIGLALVRVGPKFALDEFAGGRRYARIDLPDMRPRAEIVRFYALPWSPEQTGIDLFFANEGSARMIQSGYVVTATGFTVIR
jgi:hypothetical protein